MARRPRTTNETAATTRKPRSVKADVGVVETKEEPQPVVASKPVESPVAEKPVETPAPPKYVVHEVAPKGLILEAGEPLRIEGEVDGHEIIVLRDIYRRVYPSSAKRPSYLLVYPRGARVPKSLLQKL